MRNIFAKKTVDSILADVHTKLAEFGEVAENSRKEASEFRTIISDATESMNAAEVEATRAETIKKRIEDLITV